MAVALELLRPPHLIKNSSFRPAVAKLFNIPGNRALFQHNLLMDSCLDFFTRALQLTNSETVSNRRNVYLFVDREIADAIELNLFESFIRIS